MMRKMATTALVVDGLNYLFRGYYGIPQSAILSNGTCVNAVYGFFAFLRRSVSAVRPKYLIIIFDAEAAIASKQLIKPDYKKCRDYSDTQMFDQLVLIERILDEMNISYLEHPHFEGDDLIGSISGSLIYKELNVYISSNDFDFAQLVGGPISLLREVKGEVYRIGESEIIKRFGIKPNQYVDYMVLRGDPSDNISGVPGVGQKTASKWLLQYETLENLIENASDLPERFRKYIMASGEELLETKQFLTIDIEEKLLPFQLPDDLLFDSECLVRSTNYYLDRIEL